jgi:hypothetical protein
MIDRTGPWWKGENFDDLVAYLREFTSQNYPAERFAQSLCRSCGETTFALELDDEQGCARRRCYACGTVEFIGDSAEVWDEAEPAEAACPCGNESFELGVAFSLRSDGDIRWITVGARCTACGVLGAYVDWKIDYSPTDHLLAAV